MEKADQITHRLEPMDIFLRNFLVQMGMTETLDCFQTEWAEVLEKGLVKKEEVGVVDDVYTEIMRLHGEVKNAQIEEEEYRLAASAAANTKVSVQKVRDFHWLKHQRVVQERDRLIEDMKKLKMQCKRYEPTLQKMSEKYHTLLEQTMLMTLEEDKQLQSDQHHTNFYGNEGGVETWKGELGVGDNPVIQPKHPTSANIPRNQPTLKK